MNHLFLQQLMVRRLLEFIMKILILNILLVGKEMQNVKDLCWLLITVHGRLKWLLLLTIKIKQSLHSSRFKNSIMLWVGSDRILKNRHLERLELPQCKNNRSLADIGCIFLGQCLFYQDFLEKMLLLQVPLHPALQVEDENN